ncbi:hypothetical protein IJ425_04380 [bacterium]|nr:hypothetical protein [bacterium]
MINFNEFAAATNVSKKSENTVNKNTIIPQVKTPEKQETVLTQNPANIIISKGALATSIIATSAISAALMFGVGKLRINKLQDELAKLRKQLSGLNLQETLDKLKAAQRNVEDLTKKRESDQKLISQLQEKLKALTNIETPVVPDKTQDIAKEIQETLDKLNAAQRNVKDLTKKRESDQKLISQLQEKLKALIDAKTPVVPAKGEGLAEEIERKASKYRKQIEGLTTIYEDSKAPTYSSSIVRLGIKKVVPYSTSTLPMTPKKPESFIEGLLSDLKNKNKVEIPLRRVENSPEQMQEACLQPKALKNLGVFEDTNIELSYGKKVGWSEEKVARDILQNFYDGNNHSLDGIGLLVEKTNNGYKIRISGNGVFQHERLLRFGNTTKDNDLFEAGGFGEGAKIVYTNLLANNSTKQIHYRSADWELTFDTHNNIIRKKISKTPEVLDGNYIEFETENESLAQNIIKAFNYFRHSNNRDFQNLTYDSPDFGFRILQPGEKGNFYLTQRFEFGQDGAWENGVNGLDIIFKRKPAPDVYEKFTNKKFNTGRDRSKMDEQDIYDLTRCFASDMSDDDILQSILATQKHWLNFGTANKNRLADNDIQKESKSILSFLRALCQTAQSKGLTIDFSNSKICLRDGQYIKPEHLKVFGYTVIDAPDCGLDSVGMPKASEVLQKLKEHKAIPPTPAEAKKLKVLEEAIKVIQRNFEATYITKLKELFSNITPEDLQLHTTYKNSYPEEFFNSLPEGTLKDPGRCNFITVFIDDSKTFGEYAHRYYLQLLEKLTPENFNNEENSQMISTLLSTICSKIVDNPLMKQTFAQLKNLEIISKTDIEAPRFIFDRKKELANTTLGEAIIDWQKGYMGHWIDKTYLNTGNFYELIATWIHEICHKSGGDGTSEFTYKLTDIIESLVTISAKSPEYRSDLLALQKVFEEIK